MSLKLDSTGNTAADHDGSVKSIKRHLKKELLTLKRNRILEEATELFFDQGYSGTTVDEIAARLQVTKPFIYSYFKNKEAILAAICETGISEALDVLRAVLAAKGSYRDQLIQTLWQVGDMVIVRQPCVVIYTREMKKLNPDDAQRILSKRSEFDQRIAKLIDDGVKAGEFAAGPHAMDAIWIGGLISWLPVWYSASGKLSKKDVLFGLVEAGLKLIGAGQLTDLEKAGLN